MKMLDRYVDIFGEIWVRMKLYDNDESGFCDGQDEESEISEFWMCEKLVRAWVRRGGRLKKIGKVIRQVMIQLKLTEVWEHDFR